MIKPLHISGLVPAVQRALAEAKEHKERKKADKKLHKAHRNLETKVKKRTTALQADIAKHERVEKALYRAEQNYRLLHDTMLQGVVYQDAEGKIISMNPAAVQILGKGSEEYLDHTSDNVEHHTLRSDGSSFPGLDHPSMVALRTGQEQRDVIMGVYNPREKDYRWVNVRAKPQFRPGEDKPHQVYIIFDDITERRRIEKTLQDSEVRYRRLFEAAQDGILIVDTETGRIADVNPFLIDMLNYSKEELVGKQFWEIGAFKDIEKSKFAFAELQNNKYIRYEDLQLETKDGRLIDVEFVSNEYIVDHTKVIQCNIRDITDRKRAERRQALTSEVLSIVNDSLPLADIINGILTAIKRETRFDAVGIRLRSGDDFPYFVQNGFSNDFLLAENTVTVRAQDGGICRDKNGNISLECTCGLVISGQTDPTNHLFTQGGSFWINDSTTLLDLSPDQDPRLNPRNRCIHEGFCSVALVPIRVDREIVGLLQLNDRKKDCFTLDLITFFEGLGSSIGIALTRKQAEAAIKEQASRLEAANKELESFSYSVSHDLRAPLRAIDGYSRMILRHKGDKFDENTERQFSLIRDNVMLMNQLINDLLALSRLGKEALSMSRLNVENLARDVWGELKTINPDRPVDLKIDPVPPGMGDRSLIRQVLTNLLSNAVKFSRLREVPLIEMGGYGADSENVYYVRDNGVGFDMKYYDKLFGVFQSLHSADDFEGTGVGLAIAQRIVHRHGGRIWAESEVDRGATFYFTLPRYIGSGL